jgi:FMN-dependent NADH-azoreductase
LIISGETFQYVDGVPRGLVSPDKELIICFSSGASEIGDMFDYASGWLKTSFAFIGVNNVKMIHKRMY